MKNLHFVILYNSSLKKKVEYKIKMFIYLAIVDEFLNSQHIK